MSEVARSGGGRGLAILRAGRNALAGARAELRDRRISGRTRHSPDRIVMVREILPAFAQAGGRMLWVGCRRYTDDYPQRLEAGGGECWTTDIDPKAARFGSRGRHRTGDLTAIDTLFPDLRFDAVLCNGVFGYGVDTVAEQKRALEAIHTIAEPNGLLLLGWNTDKIADPLAEGLFAPRFLPTSWLSLDARRAVPGTTHVYDLLRRTDAPASEREHRGA